MAIEFGTFTDPRDGEVYKTVKIGDQEWMAENLRFSIRGDRVPEGNPAYGHLYGVNALAKVAPKGWRLPTRKEMESLVKSTESEKGGPTVALFATSEEKVKEWKYIGGQDTLGIGFVFAGYWSSYSKIFSEADSDAYLWCIEESGAPAFVNFCKINQNVKFDFSQGVKYYSVRLVKDDAAGAEPKKKSAKKAATGPVSDKFGLYTDPRDGQVYKTVKIGDQVWMAENFRYVDDYYSKKPENSADAPKSLGLIYKRNMDPPIGWLLPKTKDFEKLIEATGGNIADSGFVPMGNGTEEVNPKTGEIKKKLEGLALLWEQEGTTGWNRIWTWDGTTLKTDTIYIDNGTWGSDRVPLETYIPLRYIQKSKKFTPATLEDLAKHDEEMSQKGEK